MKFLFLKFQENEYDQVVNCLSNYIPKIYDESLNGDNQLIFTRNKGKINKSQSSQKNQPTVDTSNELRRLSDNRKLHLFFYL